MVNGLVGVGVFFLRVFVLIVWRGLEFGGGPDARRRTGRLSGIFAKNLLLSSDDMRRVRRPDLSRRTTCSCSSLPLSFFFGCTLHFEQREQ